MLLPELVEDPAELEKVVAAAGVGDALPLTAGICVEAGAEMVAVFVLVCPFSLLSCSWYLEMSRTRLTVSDLLAPAYIVFGRSSLLLR